MEEAGSAFNADEMALRSKRLLDFRVAWIVDMNCRRILINAEKGAAK
jgi:hypothetical protein